METLTMTNRKLQKIYGAVRALGTRRMSNVGADLKVSKFLVALEPMVVPLDKVRRQITIDLLEGQDFENMPDFKAQVIKLKIDAETEKLLDQEVEVQLPMVYVLKEADLPKEQTGTNGWLNAQGLGGIVADLCELYDWGSE